MPHYWVRCYFELDESSRARPLDEGDHRQQHDATVGETIRFHKKQSRIRRWTIREIQDPPSAEAYEATLVCTPPDDSS